MLESRILLNAQEWMKSDVSAGDQDQLAQLIAKAQGGNAEAALDLNDRFRGSLQFGTAGLRGEMAAGPNRINAATLRQAAFGLGSFAVEQVERPKVVIGYDARFHSEEFAFDSAAIFQQLGLDVWIFPNAYPTPLLAFAVRRLNADVGVMVTASHNPGKDNGYKVYLGGRIATGTAQGSQIVEPFDADIAAHIAKAPAANAIELAKTGWSLIGPEVLEEYINTAANIGSKKEADLKIVTTAMHGVGGSIQLEALKRAGFEDTHPVPQQQNPDPKFPTVVFPNPEEKGALDMALALSKELEADIFLANDPDADRLAVGEYDKHLKKWRALTGDETGAILGEHFINAIKESNSFSSSALGNSLVSSRLLGVMAAENNVNHSVTLTGLKWITRVPNLVFGYEEAIGYCPDPDHIHDKDGPTTGSLLTKIASKAKSSGKTLIDLLDDQARQYGLYLQRQLSIRLDTPEKIVALVENLRVDPPQTLDGSRVISVVDFAKNPPQSELKMNAILLLTADNTRVVVRPSGTEPKVKFYIEVVLDCENDATFEQLTALRKAADEKLTRLVNELEERGKNGDNV